VVLEAQASGLPVIAFQAEGVCDIIQDGRTGWLAAVGTADSEVANFERAILSFLGNPERRANASIEATRWAMTWRWSEATEKAVDAYREAIRGHGHN
jgi:glycosyltransferase involved in cell wall biosynthesis